MDKNKKTDIHTNHCCKNRHGCKYGEDDFCSVVQGHADGKFECDLCEDDYQEDYYK